MLVGWNESGENREQDESAQKDKWADRTFLCTSCVLWSSTLTHPSAPHPTPASWSLSRQRVQPHRVREEKKKQDMCSLEVSPKVLREVSPWACLANSWLHDSCRFEMRHASCDVWLLLDKLSAGIPFTSSGTQPRGLKRQNSSMLSVFRCLAHWSLCSPLNGRSTVLNWVAQQGRAIQVLFPQQFLKLKKPPPHKSLSITMNFGCSLLKTALN